MWAKYGMSGRQVRQCRGWQADGGARSVGGVPQPPSPGVPHAALRHPAPQRLPRREDLEAAAARSTAEGDKDGSGVRWIRSYVVQEEGGELGTFCIYEGESAEAIRAHAAASVMAADEVVPVLDTVVVRPDPVAAAA